MKLSQPEFRAGRCTRYRFRYSLCRRCADACPHEAVTLSEEGVALDGAQCQNCGLCVCACRTGALAAANLPLIDLLKKAIRLPAFSFACAPSGMGGDALVPCLGALDAAVLGYLAKRRIPIELRGSHHCGDCPHGERGAAQLAINLDALGALQEAAGEAEDWLTPILPVPVGAQGAEPETFVASRRQLFRRFLGPAVGEAGSDGEPAAVAIPDRAIRAGAPMLPEQRELLGIVGKLANAEPFLLRPHQALPLMDLDLAPGCTACEACFRVCPTGALLVEESAERWALSFDFNRCVACEVCLEVCQPGVLRPLDPIDAASRPARIRLHGLTKQRCTRCDRHFVSPDPRELCDICADDEDAFAAIFG
ncbi:MAG: 4Fe-4S ferredoxin [Chromatiaceae bacterium]|nr:4Fe-4S ferredoxin [Chromatiaceae bacterium]